MDWKGPFCACWRILRLLDTLVRGSLLLELLGQERGLFIPCSEESQWLSIITMWNSIICARILFFCFSFCNWKIGSGECVHSGSNCHSIFMQNPTCLDPLFSLRNQSGPLCFFTKKFESSSLKCG
jgi:hypothetical protein